MAAHSYRAWLFEHEGLTVWNAQWYGGHHVLGYSLLFAPLAADVRAGDRRRAARRWPPSRCSSPLARAAAPSPAAGAVAAWLFTAGVLSNVAIGRMPFLLGIALGGRRVVGRALAAARALRRARARDDARQPGRGRVPDARRGREADRRRALRRWRTAAWVGLPTLAGGIALYLLFPEGGTDRFAATAFWPMLVLSAAGVALLAPGRRTLWAGGLLYLGVLIGAFVVPSPFGQNALRLGVLAGPAVLALAHRRRVPVLALAVVGVGLLYLQWLPAVRAVAEAHGDPSTRLAFQAEARDFLARVAKPGERVEVPLTKNHWEAADLAKVVPLARGWERQLDQKANPIFYDGEELTASTLPRVAARERRPLGRAAERAARLLRARGGGRARARREVPASSSTSRRAGGSGRCATPTRRPPTARSCSPPARTGSWSTRASRPSCATATRRTGRRPDACVSRAPGGWTRVEPEADGRRARAGALRARARSARR